MKAHYYLAGARTSVCGISTVTDTDPVRTPSAPAEDICKSCWTITTEELQKQFA